MELIGLRTVWGAHDSVVRGVSAGRRRADRGFTLAELMIMGAIVGTLSIIIVPHVVDTLEENKNQRAIIDIIEMDVVIDQFIMDFGVPPDSLADVGLAGKLDPWGRPYEYLNVFSDGPGPPHPRKDHFLVPLNSDFDLYSKGSNGESRAPLTARHSRDDIVRANNGGWVGVASEY
jgi:general secretion pathway protein G